MKRFRIVWTEPAVRDYESILVCVATDSGVAAARQIDDRLDRAVRRLERTPARCRVVPELRAEGLDMYRELIVRPYRVMFRLRGADVVLLAVVDGRRDLEELLLERTLDD